MFEVVPETYYSIHPEYQKIEITESLQRLQTNYLDSYLLHNPEHILMHEMPKGS